MRQCFWLSKVANICRKIKEAGLPRRDRPLFISLAILPAKTLEDFGPDIGACEVNRHGYDDNYQQGRTDFGILVRINGILHVLSDTTGSDQT